MSARLQVQTKDAPAPSFTPARTGLLQRKCACGGAASLAGKCEGCDHERLVGLQRKLEVNRPGDQFEQEADRVADRVMRMPSTHVQRQTVAPVGPAPSGTVSAPLEVEQTLGSPGRPLDASTRAFFEPRFGHDFGHVRVHADTRAAESARAVNALAYTVGRDIAFGAGQYAPGTTEGQRLLGHELTHVLQQTVGIGTIQNRTGVGWQRVVSEQGAGLRGGLSMDGPGRHPGVEPAIRLRASRQREDLMVGRQNPGVTKCNYDTGAMEVPPVNEHCAGDCVHQHEAAHQADPIDAGCCLGVKTCLDNADAGKGTQNACYAAYNKWMERSEDRAECLGHAVEETCLTKLIAERCQGKRRGKIGKIVGGIIGAVGGFLGGYYLKKLLGGVFGSLVGGYLGYKGGGLIAGDCCDSLRAELSEVKETKEKHCGRAKNVPCPFRADGTIT